MKNFLLLFLITFPLINSHAQNDLITKFNKTGGKETVTYKEGIAYFSKLAREFDIIAMQEHGETDSGHPLHLLLFSTDRDFDISSIKRKGKRIILINNAIHPGEPDGVDASMMLLRDLAGNKEALKRMENTVLAVIPFYNIGGALNRNSYSRANQNGPEAYGFRGNAQNLDLNRDFIKNDSKNARSFARIFHWLDPEVYLENHVSNGADYQYVMTLLSTQHNKLGGGLGDYLNSKMIPKLEQKMENKNFPMTPYVNVWGTTPDAGFAGFMDFPRYSTGYAALFQTLAFMPETHMLKPYKDRVAATYAFMEAMIEVVNEEGDVIAKLRGEERERVKGQERFVLDWEIDSSSYREFNFMGYEASYPESKITGQRRLYYDKSKPYDKAIPYYNNFSPAKIIEKPEAYIIPQGWHEVIELLKLNQVTMRRLPKDSTIAVEVYHIKDFETTKHPYEGHYIHSGTEVETRKEEITFLKGDYIIPVNQVVNRYIVETLEPEAPDSFFNWNFFDAILQQKEHFSAYVFEDIAARLLEENTELKANFMQKKKKDLEFAEDSFAQLNFIYKNSSYYEPAHNRYPVYRWVN